MQQADHKVLPGQPANEPGRKRKSARRSMRLAVPMARGDGEAVPLSRATILDLSAGGMLFECNAPLRRGEWISVELPLAGRCRAEIIWAADLLFGCRFDRELADRAVTAAHAVGTAVQHTDGPDPELARTLAKARQTAGWSLEALAGKLGVSKQTVWFWEKGRHTPSPDRLAALQQVLGLQRDESPRHHQATSTPLSRIVAQAKEDIASAAGTSADQVSITIGW